MSNNCYAILTALGQAMVAESISQKTPVNLIEIAVGDADYSPNEGQAALMHERARFHITEIMADQDNPAWIRIMAVIPPGVGGWHIHEAGVFADNGNLFAVAKLDGSYKPVYSDGMLKEIALDIILEVSNEANINMIIDPNLITVTRQWVIDYVGAKIASLKDLFENHIKDFNNPHKVTPEQLGVYKKEEVEALFKAFNVFIYPAAFHNFYLLSPPKGWKVRNGAVLPKADTAFPELWAALKKTENAWLLLSETAWQSKSALAGGIGGVPWFVLNDSAKTIRLPDTRGDFVRDAGLNGQSVGQWQKATFVYADNTPNAPSLATVLGHTGWEEKMGADKAGDVSYSGLSLAIIGSGGVETAPAAAAGSARGRNFATLGCVYVGEEKSQ